jgi:large subunit ribosomal protein L9
MKVVLLKDLPHKGKQGDIKDVPDGYARNYLLPNGLAVQANPATIEAMQSRVNAIENRRTKEKEEIKELAKVIDGQELYFQAKAASGKDRIHGSITSADIADKLSSIIGQIIDKKKVLLDEPLHQLGSHDVTINLLKDYSVKIKVNIEAEKT